MAGPQPAPPRPDVPRRPFAAARTDAADDDEERRPPPPPQRRPGRARRLRQDDARRATPVRAGAIPRLGSVDDGTAHLDFEPEEQKRRESLSLAVATFEHDGTRISLVDTPGYPDFIAEVIEGFAAADGALFVMDASRRRRGRPRAGRRPRPLDRAPPPASSSTSPTARTPNPTAALDALRAASATRSRRSSSRSARPSTFKGYVDLVHRKACELGTARRGRGPDPGRPGRRGRHPPRPAPRGRGRGRRRRPDEVPRGRGDLRPRARGLPAQGRQGVDPGPGAGRQRDARGSACAACSTRSSATCPPPPTRRRSRPRDKAGRGRRGRRRRGRPAPRPRLQDDRRPVRRPADLPARPVAARSTRRPTSGTRAASEDERIGQLLLLHGKEQEPIGELKAGEIGAVAKLTVPRPATRSHRARSR